MKHINLLLPFLSLVLCASAAEIDPAARKDMDKRFARIQKLEPRMGVRDLFREALKHAHYEYKPERIERLLELAEEMQDLDPDSKTYGNFKWYWGSERVIDRNAVQFSMQKASLVWMLYRDRLSPAAQEKLERLMQMSIEGIRRHDVKESYTNIYLMKIWNSIAIGEALGDAKLTEEGYQMLDRWLMYTGECGIHEYLSPTYYSVDLENLGLIANHAKRPEGRAKAEAALRLFWTDIAANWFGPCQRIAGAHSRDYDYLTGHGNLAEELSFLNWTDIDRTPTMFKHFSRWDPQDELILPIIGTIPRTVQQRWGDGPGEHATHYVGRNFSIGSAGASYGPMDKPLAINFGGDPKTVMANFFLDARGDPYGKNKCSQKSGHTKALHLKPFLTSVQRGPEVLLLASSDPNTDRYIPDPACLLAHLVLPVEAKVHFEDENTAFVRFSDVAAGVRFMLGGPVKLVEDGGKHPAKRISCILSEGKPTGRGTVAIHVHAKEGLDDEGFARFRQQFSSQQPLVKKDGSVLDISVGKMHLKADVANELRLVNEGAEPGTGKHLLAINGRDLGLEIMGKIDVVANYRKSMENLESGTGAAEKTEKMIEAEDAALLLSPFVVEKDPKASGGKYIVMPNDFGSKGGARASYSLEIPKAGDYYLHARVHGPSGEDDSFFVRIYQDGSDVLPLTDWHIGRSDKWKWATLKKDKKIQPLPLRKGRAIVEFRVREDGSKLDALMLSKKPVKTPKGG
ncbi:MAG: hypothetical protein K9M45_08200 [Kiritimatiellales bacterium]|nr:hypothetical protein [Kiritimatiellales bacterium]